MTDWKPGDVALGIVDEEAGGIMSVHLQGPEGLRYFRHARPDTRWIMRDRSNRWKATKDLQPGDTLDDGSVVLGVEA